MGNGRICLWTEDEDGNWNPECDYHQTFCFINDGPKKNNWKYCPYCSRELREEPFDWSQNENEI